MFEKTAHASEQQWAYVLRRRQPWFDAQPDLEPERLVFIDETGPQPRWRGVTAGCHGRAAPGPTVNHGHRNSTPFVGALRLEEITAPMVLDGAMHGDAFLAYVEKVPVPPLNSGDIVITDNLPPTSAKTTSLLPNMNVCNPKFFLSKI